MTDSTPTPVRSHRQLGRSFDDHPYRRVRRDEHGQFVTLTADEWQAGGWYDVTSLDDPADVHVYVRTGCGGPRA